MPRQTFSFRPDYDSQLSQEPSVIVTKFGDGYEQRVTTGINNSPEKWSLTFTVGNPALPAALAFVQARKGVESFYWQNSFGVTNVYVCRRWNMSRTPGKQSLSMEFEQVFEA
jgi:phage-related protein